MMRHSRRILLSLLFSLVPAAAIAQQVTDKCSPQPAQAGAKATGAGLLATYKCISAAYNPQSSRVDVVNFVQDLEHAGVKNLLTGNFGLSTQQRLLILDDYGFWAAKAGGDEEPQNAVNALNVVTSIEPHRAVAWLNLGDAYMAARNYGALVFGDHSTRLPSNGDEVVRGQKARAAYKQYLRLSPHPLQRVRDYVALVTADIPAGVENWSTFDAINHMVAYPHAAAIVLANDNSREAKLALAMDLGLLLPKSNSHGDEIQALLDAGAVETDTHDNEGAFDGTAASFEPYILNIEQSPLQGEYQNFPLTCQIVRKFPELAVAAEGYWGGNRDSFDPIIVCGDKRFTLPASVKALNDDLKGPSGFGQMCGSISGAMVVTTWFDADIVAYLPQMLLPPYPDPNQDPGLAAIEDAEADDLTPDELSAGATPLASWGETDIDSYRKARKIAVDFHRARADLANYYRTSFGLSPADAALAASHGVWLIQGAYRWALPKKLDPLAEALLGHKPLTQVQVALKSNTAVPDSMLFLAVEYPEALKLLLDEKLDATVTTNIGKTVLMEAAKYNQLESVKLLLAAGVNVNAVSLAPSEIEGNALGQLCTNGADIITHGHRTALMYAAANAELPVIETLLAAGADKQPRDSMGATALDYLEGKGPVKKNSVLTPSDFAKAETLLAP